MTLFAIGQIVATPAALAAIDVAGITPLDLILRHANGNYGNLDRDDIAANLLAIEKGLRILSKYVLLSGESVYVITEADRSSTCLLLTDEY